MTPFVVTWADGHHHYSYILVPFCIMLCYRFLVQRRSLLRLMQAGYIPLMLQHYSMTKKVIKILLLAITCLFVLLALSRPQWGKQEQRVEQTGRDLLIAVDISRSMLAQDCKPNRLEYAKEKIKKLLYNLSCERVGLLVFSSSTIVQCPLTTDYGAFYLFLDQLNVETISQGTTAIDQVMQSAINLFAQIPSRKTKLLVIFTDGEDFSANLTAIKDRALQERLSIFTMGVGTEHGAPIPIINEKYKQVGFEKDARGHVIMSCLNKKLLQEIAAKSGGKYIAATDDATDIASLIATINQFEKDALEDKTVQLFQEQYPYFIAVAFGCYLLEWLL
jgi:Ca-activated chloride channel family protein